MGSDVWLFDRHAELAPLASALTDTTNQAAALVGAALVRPPVRSDRSGSAAESTRIALMAVYLGRSTTWAVPVGDAEPTPPAEPPPTAPSLASLASLQRAVWALREVEQLTQAEIASILDRPPAAVGRVLEEAYARLGSDSDVTVLGRRTVEAPGLADVRRAFGRSQRLRSRRAVRTRGLIALGVLVVAAVVAVPTYVIPHQPVYVRRQGERVFMHAVTPPKGWQVDSRTLFEKGEGTFVSRTYGGAVPCSVFVELDPEPSVPKDRTTPVRINGRPGVYDPDDASGPSITWRVDDRARVLVSCQPQTAQDMGDAGRANLVLLAEAVSFERTPILVPYALTVLPAGYAVSALTDEGDGSTSFELARIDPHPWDVALVVRYQSTDASGTVVSPRTVQVNGREAILSSAPSQPTLCFIPPGATKPATVCIDAYLPTLTDDPLSAVPAAVLSLMTQTAESLSFSGDPTDRSSWVDARTAFPH